MYTRILKTVALCSLFVLGIISKYNAQSYTENFDNIGTLSGSGWYIQNNSNPAGANTWFQGTPTNATPDPGPFDAYNGALNAYIGVNFASTTGGTGTISNWLVTPNRTLRNGDVFSFFTRKPFIESGDTDFPDRLEVRMSTNGASTNVGSNSSATGDFTTLLLSINPTLTTNVYPQSWTQYTITISGLPAPTSGRIAFRYFVTNGGPTGSNSDYIGIDNVIYTPYVCPAFTMTPGGALTGGAAGSAYSTTLTQAGALGAPNYAITAGSLPPGLTLSSGGTISGTPTATGTFNFTGTVSDASGCTGSQAYSITVVCPANPTSLNGLPTLCSNDSPITLTQGLPAGGTYSGTGVTGESFDPAAGTQSITYDYTDPYGCAYSASNTITVNAAPIVTQSTIAAVCDNNGTVALSSGSPAGGTYSGTGVTGTDFDPAAGDQTITYSYTDINGCSNSADQTITVNPSPTVNLDPIPSICDNSEPLVLTGGSPAGGSFSGSAGGVTTENVFDPMSGSQIIYYNYSDANGCTNSAVQFITVNTAPTVTQSPFSPACNNTVSLTLTGGSPAGGTYSGIGVTGGEFDPFSGTQTITYTYTDANGCTNSTDEVMTIYTSPSVSQTPYSPVCNNSGIFVLTGGSPAGGTYSGTGVTGTDFDPTAGTQTITYLYIDTNGCGNSTDETITVYSVAAVTQSSFPATCSNVPNFPLSGGSPAGGTYSGTGVTGTNFDPAAGTQTVTYSYTDANGCVSSADVTITVNTAPVVSFTLTTDQLCIDNAEITLSGGSPVGGQYSGDGVAGGTFDPATAGLGTTTITYMYVTADGCVDMTTDDILVDECLSINEENTAAIAVYPNPSRGLFEVAGLNENSTVKVIDAQGRTIDFNQTVISNTQVAIDLSAMPNGIYLLSIENTKSTNVIRLVKN